MSTTESRDIPATFLELWNAGKRMINPQRQERRPGLYRLPVSLRVAADLTEQDPAYHRFLEAVPWQPKPSLWRISEALRRAGFYHAIQDGREPHSVWAHLTGFLTPHTARLRTLVLLDGCWFSVDKFHLTGATVDRVAVDDLQSLGPGGEIASVFFPNEALDPAWYSNVWFMSQERDQEINPTSLSFRLGYDVLSHFWQPILALALYKTDFFRLPIVLESERGWRLERIQWSEPSVDIIDDQEGGAEEVPRRDYRVAEEEQGRFAAFTRFFESTIEKAREFQMFRLAGRRYLRAVQIAGPYSFAGDDYEDALLQYVFALEALLSEGTPGGIGDRIATRAAWLVGTSDQIRHDAFKTVKKLYDARSSIVHGRDRDREERHGRKLDETRDLMRRILIGLMAVRASVGSDEECLALLRTAAFSRSSQSHIIAATESVWTLIDPGIEWPGESWGPKYDRPPFNG